MTLLSVTHAKLVLHSIIMPLILALSSFPGLPCFLFFSLCSVYIIIHGSRRAALPLLCILLNADRKQRMGEAWERGYPNSFSSGVHADTPINITVNCSCEAANFINVTNHAFSNWLKFLWSLSHPVGSSISLSSTTYVHMKSMAKVHWRLFSKVLNVKWCILFRGVWLCICTVQDGSYEIRFAGVIALE